MRLVNFRLLDGSGGDYAAAALETDEAGRILRLWTSRHDLPSATGSIDLDGRCVLPGLFDCHVHLTADASANPVAQRVAASEGDLAILAAFHATRTLRRGITTARDTGAPHFADIAVKRAIAAGLVEGPRLLCSGKMLTMTGGHGCMVGQEIDGPVEARKFARLNLKMGADNIKMVASGGVTTPHVDPRAASLTVEELSAGFEEAKKAGKLSACHAHSVDGVKNAVRAGVRTVEHGVWLDEEACSMMRSAGVYLCPTLSVVHHLVQHLSDPAMPTHVREKVPSIAADHLRSFKLAWEMGVKIICGTDAGMPFTPHGCTATEIRLMVEAGVPPDTALRIATSQSAEAMGLGAVTGSIAIGKTADLLVVDGDPLSDVGVLAEPVSVFKAGRCVFGEQRGEPRSSAR